METIIAFAFGIASALFKRERTGEPSVVDVSLLATAMWVLSSDVAYSGNPEYDPHALHRNVPANPVAATYPTRDGRWIGTGTRHLDHAPDAEHYPDLEAYLAETGRTLR